MPFINKRYRNSLFFVCFWLFFQSNFLHFFNQKFHKTPLGRVFSDNCYAPRNQFTALIIAILCSPLAHILMNGSKIFLNLFDFTGTHLPVDGKSPKSNRSCAKLEWNILNFFESIYLGKKPNDVNYHYHYYYNLNTRPAEIASIFIPNVISNPTRSNVCRYE